MPHARLYLILLKTAVDTYADDLATLIETLDLSEATLIGFFTGGGEVARYIGRHGTARVAKAALISKVFCKNSAKLR
jgi:pimeloyl-ACP methyl ester carboxylesterase